MDEKRTVEELIELYSLEPSIKEIFVEGDTDRSFITWFLREKDFKEVSVNEIDSIEIPDVVMQKYALPKNNKGELIALAFTIGEKFKDSQMPIFCILDSDNDFLFNHLDDIPCVHRTDYANLEMYGFNLVVFQKFALLYARKAQVQVQDVLNDFKEILINLFLIENANIALNWNCSKISLKKYIVNNGTRLFFDNENYIKNYLNTKGKIKELENFQEKIFELKNLVIGEPRKYINGHDLIELLDIYLKKICKLNLLWDEQSLTRTYYSCFEVRILDGENLFISLLDWC